jgi:hypothetical protein
MKSQRWRLYGTRRARAPAPISSSLDLSSRENTLIPAVMNSDKEDERLGRGSGSGAPSDVMFGFRLIYNPRVAYYCQTSLPCTYPHSTWTIKYTYGQTRFYKSCDTAYVHEFARQYNWMYPSDVQRYLCYNGNAGASTYRHRHDKTCRSARAFISYCYSAWLAIPRIDNSKHCRRCSVPLHNQPQVHLTM